MIYSLSEIEANCKKAARGSGLSWGYAEEVGKAARWLAAHQLPGIELLAEYLTKRQKNPQEYTSLALQCPLLVGAGICDAGRDSQGHSITVERVVYPLLVLPYLAQLSEVVECSFRVQWPGTQIGLYSGTLYITEGASVANSGATSVTIDCLASNESFGLNLADVRKKGVTGKFVDPNSWAALEALAYLTYVPATEASRLGAGPAD